MKDEERYPYVASAELQGPYARGEAEAGWTEAWFYRDGTKVNCHAQFVVDDKLYHIVVDVPTKGKQKRSHP
jgi:hypothetical protein